jgi:hypothetical protein
MEARFLPPPAPPNFRQRPATAIIQTVTE